MRWLLALVFIFCGGLVISQAWMHLSPGHAIVFSAICALLLAAGGSAK